MSMEFVSPGWTEYIPEQAGLSRYKDNSGILFNHILQNTMDFDCIKKTKLIVQDCLGDKLFISWLEASESRIKWGREILKSDNMAGVTLAVILALDWNKKSRVLWKDLFGEEISSEPRLYPLLNFLTLEKLRKSRKEVAVSFRLIIDKDKDGCFADKFFSCVLSSPQLSNWIMEAFTKEELLSLLSDKETRVSYIVGLEIENVYKRWGKEFSPGSILQFRHKFGKYKGCSLFTHKALSEDAVMKIVWGEIEDEERRHLNAFNVMLEDENLGLLKALSKSLIHLERKIMGCYSSSGLSGSKSDILEKRIQQIAEIGREISNFLKLIVDLECEAEGFKYILAAYTRLPDKKIVQSESKTTYPQISEVSKLFRSFFGSSLSSCNEHHVKALNRLFNLPFELVLNLLINCEQAKNPHPNLICKLADTLVHAIY